MKTPRYIVTFGALIIAGILFGLGMSSLQKKDTQQGQNVSPERMTLTGTYLCLPHKETASSVTLECAIGMQTDEGNYYSLDFSLMSQIPPVLSAGQRFTANGVVTPIEMLSSTYIRDTYPVKGIFSITDSVVIE